MATHPGAKLKPPKALREDPKKRPRLPHSAYQVYVEHEYPKIARQYGDVKVWTNSRDGFILLAGKYVVLLCPFKRSSLCWDSVACMQSYIDIFPY